VESAALDPHQRALLAELRAYCGVDPVEESHRAAILVQVEATPLWWHRDTLPGHVTASAFVIDAAMDRLLLHHHRKLDRWLQLGGHDDGERDPARAVLREVREESGLAEFAFLGGQPTILDLDVHAIPARGAMPAHDHLDVRFLIVADPAATLSRDAAESKELAWFAVAEGIALMDEEAAERVGRKIAGIRAALRPLRR